MLFLWIDLRRTCHHSEGSAVESGRQKGEETILPFLFFEYIDVTRAQGRGKTWHALIYQLKHASFHQSILYRNKMMTLSGSSSGDPNPCRYGVPALGQNQNKLICGPVDSSQCPKGHYCHIGENPATTACCEGSGCMLKRFHSFYWAFSLTDWSFAWLLIFFWQLLTARLINIQVNVWLFFKIDAHIFSFLSPLWGMTINSSMVFVDFSEWYDM